MKQNVMNALGVIATGIVFGIMLAGPKLSEVRHLLNLL